MHENSTWVRQESMNRLIIRATLERISARLDVTHCRSFVFRFELTVVGFEEEVLPEVCFSSKYGRVEVDEMDKQLLTRQFILECMQRIE